MTSSTRIAIRTIWSLCALAAAAGLLVMLMLIVQLAVRYPAERLAPFFTDCRAVATIETPHDVPNEIRGTPVHVCRGLRGTWDEVWPRLRHLS